jgi:hypothetical protein
MNEIEISVVTGHPNEKWACQQLLRLFEQYDLSRWQFTDRVQIQHMAIAHSHPILTLNSRYLADDNAALSTYLYEQLHWFAVQRPLEMANADVELRQRYPAVPSFDAGGARARTHLPTSDRLRSSTRALVKDGPKKRPHHRAPEPLPVGHHTIYTMALL